MIAKNAFTFLGFPLTLGMKQGFFPENDDGDCDRTVRHIRELKKGPDGDLAPATFIVLDCRANNFGRR
jgi:hypothetical protein